ncbi:MAG TPA: hypothetical protein VGC14_02525 [Rhizobium sp.]
MVELIMATDLYHRVLTYDYGDKERSDLMAKVWNVTPFVVNVRTGSIDSEEYRAMIDWLRDTFGDQAWPIHGRAGQWQTGRATVFGETFIGFQAADGLAAFRAKYGDRIVEAEVA